MARAKPVRVTEGLFPRIVVVGCGGTGGALLPNLCRLLYGLKHTPSPRTPNHHRPLDQRGPFALNAAKSPAAQGETPLLIVDGDIVERPNLARQPFTQADLGKKKAVALADRLSGAYGLEVSAYPRYIDEATNLSALIPEGSVVVGCVDNGPTRRILHDHLTDYSNVVYLDSGNATVPESDPNDPDSVVAAREGGWEGQVTCGVRRDNRTALAFPAETFPDLTTGDDPLPKNEPPIDEGRKQAQPQAQPQEAACGQVVQSLPQRHATNLYAATTLMSYLTPLITEGVILNHTTFFDARQNYLRSVPAIDALPEVALT